MIVVLGYVSFNVFGRWFDLLLSVKKFVCLESLCRELRKVSLLCLVKLNSELTSLQYAYSYMKNVMEMKYHISVILKAFELSVVSRRRDTS